MPQLQKKERPTAEQIEAAYRDGYMSAGERNDKMRRLARATLDDTLAEDGYGKALIRETVKNLQAGWDNIVEGATDEQSGIIDYGKGAGKVFWGQVQILTSAFNAIGTVTGMVAEKMALSAGASPGLAKVINVAVDVGTGFVPLGVAVRSGVKGVQAIGQKVVGKAGEKAAAEATEQAAKQAEKVVDDAIKQGLEADGVKVARNFPQGTMAVKMKDGSVVADADAGLHIDVVVNKKLNPDDVASSGYIFNGEYKSGRPVFDDKGNLADIVGPTRKPDWNLPPDQRTPASVAQEANAKLAQARKVIKQGLEVEGVKVASKAEELVKRLSPQEAFAEAYKKFLGEMKDVTATKSFEMADKEAAKLGLTVDDIRALFPGKKINDAEVVAYLRALDAPFAEITNLALRGLNGEAGALEAMGKMMADDFFNFIPKFRSASVTGGRIVKYHDQDPRVKAFSKMLMGWDSLNIAKGDFNAALRTMAEDIVAATEKADVIKAFQLQGMKALQETGETWWGYAREGFVNLLLARPITWTRQIVGNSISMTTRSLERELAGWMSIDDVNGVVKHEGWADIRGKTMALGEGLQAFGDAFKQVHPSEASRLDFIPHKIPGILGRIMNSPGDVVRGIDNFARAVASRGDHYAMALRKGARQGLRDDELTNYVAQRAWHPTQEMIEHGQAIGRADAFMSDLGTFGVATQRVAQWGPLSLYFPFWKSPINLLKWGW